MPAPHGREHQSVIERLLEEPQQFGFFQAVRLAVQWLGEPGVPAGQALAHHIRFRNSLSMGFPPSEVEELAVEPGAHGQQLRITPTFMGFLGAQGTLPAHFTERILAWQSSEQDEAPRAFLDMLSNRMLALFYEAWSRYRVEVAMADGQDGFLPLLLSLAGHPAGSGEVPDEVIGLYAGLLQQRPVSSVVLGRLLSGFLGVRVAVAETVDYWDVLDPLEQTALGVANAGVGATALIGERSWRPDLRARLSIGPLSRVQYEHFLPGRPGGMALRKMLALCAEPTVAYEVVLVLRAGEAGPASLACMPGPGVRLGLDTFLLDGPARADRTDMRYEIRTMDPLPPLQPRAPA